MKFSFEGGFEELQELGRLISGVGLDDGKLSRKDAEGIVEQIDKADTEDLHTAPSDEPAVDVIAQIVENPCIDPTTDQYYEAFNDMCKALDQLAASGKQDEVSILLEASSTDGTYGGVPPKEWKTVEKKAIKMLKKNIPTSAITLKQLTTKASSFVKSNKISNRPKLKALLDAHKVENLSLLHESDYEEFNRELDNLIGGKE